MANRLSLVGLALLLASSGRAADFVIQISVDGLGASYLQSLVNLGEVPNFARFQTEGAWTNNARTDYDYTVTLPNHTSMLTGRPVLDKFADAGSGHHWTDNGEPEVATLHTQHGSYVSSTFNVVHDYGLTTSLYATKSKFVLYRQSYDATAGGLDLTGADNGRNKIDTYVNTPADSSSMMNSFLLNMAASPSRYSFLHFHDPDSGGHGTGWGGADYNAAVKAVDGYLGSIFNLINTNPQLMNRTVIIVSADHGGNGTDHGNNWIHWITPFPSMSGEPASRRAPISTASIAPPASTRESAGPTMPRTTFPPSATEMAATLRSVFSAFRRFRIRRSTARIPSPCRSQAALFL